MNITTRTMELSGSSYEIGRKLGEVTASIPPLKELHTSGFKGFDEVETEKAMAMFPRWCPRLNDELQGFADVLQVPLYQSVSVFIKAKLQLLVYYKYIMHFLSKSGSRFSQ